MVRGCALIDSRLDTAKICSDGRVHVDHAQLPVVLGEKKRFYTAWVKSGSRPARTACPVYPLKADMRWLASKKAGANSPCAGRFSVAFVTGVLAPGWVCVLIWVNRPAVITSFDLAAGSVSPGLDPVPACCLPRHGDSSQRGDETIRLTPIPKSRAGFRSVLKNRWASSTFVAQRSSQRATRKSTRAANRS